MRNSNIVACKYKNSVKPKTIREIGFDRFLRRKIISWSSVLGTYGMGGPGFFGIKLEKTNDYNEEWFVLRLWNASEWLLLDGEWVAANLIYYATKKPLFSNFAKVFVKEGPWDYFTDKLIDFEITRIVINNNSSCLELQNSTKKHVLEIPENLSLLPKCGGGSERKWFPEESQLDAWILSDTEELWVDG